MEAVNTDANRKQVSIYQLVALLEFLKEHPELAKGSTRGRRGELHSVKLWHLCAKKLNAITDGTSKDRKGWAKYWCDWKYRVRRKALELHAYREHNRPTPEGMTNLTALEETMLSIIGHNNDNVVIKRDPLADRESDDNEPEDNGNNEDLAPQYNDSTLPSTSNHREGMHSATEMSDADRSPRRASMKRQSKSRNRESDSEDDTREFLRIEKKRLKSNEQMLTVLRDMATQVTRIADIMSEIKDVFVERRLNK